MKEKCLNNQQVTKTICFELKPVGETEENLKGNEIVIRERERLARAQEVKKIMDEFYKFYLEYSLQGKFLDAELFDSYCSYYFNSTKKDNEKKKMEEIEELFRKYIANNFIDKDSFFSGNFLNNLTTLFGNDAEKIAELPSVYRKFRENNEERFFNEKNENLLNSFKNFSLYFDNYFKNRKFLFGGENKKGNIVYRSINENLPKFLDNGKIFQKILGTLPEENILELNSEWEGLNYGMTAQDTFTLDTYNFPLTQAGIDIYNGYIGGFSYSDGTKSKGLNEYISLYNQQVAKSDKSKKLPLLKSLYKQILSDKNSFSFKIDKFECDDEVLEAVNSIYCDNVKNAIEESSSLISSIDTFNTNGIYICSGSDITTFSQQVFGNWNIVMENWYKEYDILNSKKKRTDTYNEKRAKAYRAISSFSLSKLQELGNGGNVCEYYKTNIIDLKNKVFNNYEKAKELLSEKYTDKKRLSQNESAVEPIKNLLDSIKEYEKFVLSLTGSGKEEEKDYIFYGKLLPLIDEIKLIDGIYNKVRNYLSAKPYSEEKIKLFFDCGSFLSGWNCKKDYESNSSVFFEKDDKYYLGIFCKGLSKEDIAYLKENSVVNPATRFIYKQQVKIHQNSGRVFFNSAGTKEAPAIATYNLPITDELKEIHDKGYFKTEYRKKDPELYKKSLAKLIDYYKIGFSSHPDYNQFSLCWKDTEEYKDISEFYADVENSCYKLDKEQINFEHLLELVKQNKTYLFQIYTKDFSENSYGIPNLNTLYFKMLFDERNLKNVVYKLAGGAELFYREASISEDEKVVHPKNQPIKNKNPNNKKRASTFKYDMIKDRRYTKSQYSLHLSVKCNFKSHSSEQINDTVINSLKNTDKHYIIGIDRGERNLIYISVIDENANIVKQKSYNIIETDLGHIVDYHKLLEFREKDRDKAKKSWKSIENIKELKEGYISQVVHEICELAVEYDAVIAMEDLNNGFINSRKKIDKQVYKKFDDALVSKLQFFVNKKTDILEEGGLLNAYQLTEGVKQEGNKGKQNGIVFYVPAWLTSKIDPTTGFFDFIKPKYTSVSAAIALFSKFEDIRYNEKDCIFEFVITDNNNKQWIVCSNGDRIDTFRNPLKNNEWDTTFVIPTKELKNLFTKFNIDYKSNLKEQILNQTEKDFFYPLTKILSLILQMRNSIPNSETDYLISPVRNNNGNFYDSRNYTESDNLPCNADANGAYNIARKALYEIEKLKLAPADSSKKEKVQQIKNAEWIGYAQG